MLFLYNKTNKNKNEINITLQLILRHCPEVTFFLLVVNKACSFAISVKAKSLLKIFIKMLIT